MTKPIAMIVTTAKIPRPLNIRISLDAMLVSPDSTHRHFQFYRPIEQGRYDNRLRDGPAQAVAIAQRPDLANDMAKKLVNV
jgi:hypothetical protein